MTLHPFAQDGLLETVDLLDRRVHYVNVRTEDGSLGLIAWIGPRAGARMICECSDGRQIYEDRLDGSLTWADAGCEHEVQYLATLQERTIQRPQMPANSGMFE